MEVHMATKLFVGNLPFNTTTAELEALFGQVGAVSSVNIITDKFTGRSRGFGFVEMGNSQEAQVAIERFNGHELQGRALTVNEAKPQESRSGGGRSFGGGGRGGYRGSGGFGGSGGRARRES
jgi:cold-inducible RNA-binding protein